MKREKRGRRRAGERRGEFVGFWGRNEGESRAAGGERGWHKGEGRRKGKEEIEGGTREREGEEEKKKLGER